MPRSASPQPRAEQKTQAVLPEEVEFFEDHRLMVSPHFGPHEAAVGHKRRCSGAAAARTRIWSRKGPWVSRSIW